MAAGLGFSGLQLQYSQLYDHQTPFPSGHQCDRQRQDTRHHFDVDLVFREPSAAPPMAGFAGDLLWHPSAFPKRPSLGGGQIGWQKPGRKQQKRKKEEKASENSDWNLGIFCETVKLTEIGDALKSLRWSSGSIRVLNNGVVILKIWCSIEKKPCPYQMVFHWFRSMCIVCNESTSQWPTIDGLFCSTWVGKCLHTTGEENRRPTLSAEKRSRPFSRLLGSFLCWSLRLLSKHWRCLKMMEILLIM